MAYKEEVTKAVQDYSSDIKWINDRLDRVNNRISDDKKMFRLLVRILVDKKILSAELAKTFEETQSNEELLNWFLNDDEREKEEGK